MNIFVIQSQKNSKHNMKITKSMCKNLRCNFLSRFWWWGLGFATSKSRVSGLRFQNPVFLFVFQHFIKIWCKIFFLFNFDAQNPWLHLNFVMALYCNIDLKLPVIKFYDNCSHYVRISIIRYFFLSSSSRSLCGREENTSPRS